MWIVELICGYGWSRINIKSQNGMIIFRKGYIGKRHKQSAQRIINKLRMTLKYAEFKDLTATPKKRSRNPYPILPTYPMKLALTKSLQGVPRVLPEAKLSAKYSKRVRKHIRKKNQSQPNRTSGRHPSSVRRTCSSTCYTWLKIHTKVQRKESTTTKLLELLL